MLYIRIKNKHADVLDQERIWYIGCRKPITHDIGKYRYLEIQADGDELEYIRDNFPGLVIPAKSVVNWYGDMAKFILGNL